MDTMNHFVNSSEVSEEIARIFETLNYPRIYEKDMIVYNQGETASAFFYLKKGRIRVFMTSESGMEKTLATINKGTVFGEAAFFDGKPRVSSAITLTRSEIIVLHQEKLKETIRSNPEIAMELLRMQAQTIRMLSMQVDSITFLQANNRIAQFLLQSAVLHSGVWVVPTTHEEIASVVGTSRVTVSKIINSFAEKGMVKTGYRKIIILSVDKLREETKMQSKNDIL